MNPYDVFPILSPDISATPSLIRLLTILPGTRESPLRSKLQVVDLNDPDCPAYEAVSYRWDDVEATLPMEVESITGILIRPNLAAALRRFRMPGVEITLWTDAVCIDQRSSVEKNQQIRIMGRIFRQAARVLVWLKPEMADVDLTMALQLMYDLCALFKNPQYIALGKTLSNGSFRGGSETSFDLCQQFGIASPISADFAALRRLANNSWFPRAWTSQESFLAREKIFHSGQGEDLKWGSIYLYAAFLVLRVLYGHSTDGDLFPPAFQKACTKVGAQSEMQDDRLTLLDLLQQRRGSECKFKADLVYSLLGTVAGPLIQVDVNLPFSTVFTTSAFEIMRHYGNLNILGYVELREQPSSLPSWVPDWRHEGKGTGWIARGFVADSNYPSHATSRSVPEIELINGSTLKAVGIQLDIILPSIKIPRSMEQPDWEEVILVLLFGGRVPYILRPEGEGHYTYVCECWVECFMDGEGMDAARRNPQVFLID